jgi:TolB protein
MPSPLLSSRRLLTIVSCTCLWVIFVNCWESSCAADHVSLGPGKITFSIYVDNRWKIAEIRPGNPQYRLLSQNPTDLHYPAVSPTTNRGLAYYTSSGELIVGFGHAPAHVQNDSSSNWSHPAWSPGGEHLAFTFFNFSSGAEDSDLWIVDLISKQTWPLVKHPGMQKHAAWSPDGKLVAYTHGFRKGHRIFEQIWTVAVENGEPNALLADRHINNQPAWSPDGKTIAFSSNRNGNMDIWTMDSKGSNLKAITSHPAMDSDPAWSPDGRYICFSSTRSGKMQLWMISVETKRVLQIPMSSGTALQAKDPCWSE